MHVKTIWVISELYYPEETSTGYFLTRIAEALTSVGSVKIISGLPTYSEIDEKVFHKESRNGTVINRMWSTRFPKDFLLGRILNQFTFTASSFFFFLFSARKNDHVLIVTNPPLLSLFIGLAAKFKRLSSTLLVHDVYPDVLIASGYLRRDCWQRRLLDVIFNFAFGLFDNVIVLGRDMAVRVRKKFGKNSPIMHIVPNWGDTQEVQPLARGSNPFAQAHRLVNKTVIQFSGNLGRTHDIELVMRTAERLTTENDIVFLFVGYGGKSNVVGERQKDNPLPNVMLLPRQNRDMLGPMLACADATVIAFIDQMLGVSVPSRMYNVMAAGTPIIAIADSKSELSLVTAENDCGWVLPVGDEDALERLIRDIHSKAGKIRARRKGLNGRQAVEALFSKDVILAHYQSIFSSDIFPVDQGIDAAR
jgi:colanic acid biosynthesis glycosyl transferase WcaI